jgi:hypothetical protein
MTGPENRDYCGRDPSRRPRDTLCQQNLALASPANGCLSAGIFPSLLRPQSLFVFVFRIHENSFKYSRLGGRHLEANRRISFANIHYTETFCSLLV